MSRPWLLAGFLALGACSSSPEPGRAGAFADLINRDGRRIGEAMFAHVEGADSVVLRLRAWDLPPGTHGFHIHDRAHCDSPDFQTAGGHFNPYQRKHGLKNPEGPHAGDLPNLVVPENGRVDITLTIRGVTLGEGKNSLLRPGGTCLVIHSDPDDETTDPAGNSGSRIACGLIRSATPAELETR